MVIKLLALPWWSCASLAVIGAAAGCGPSYPLGGFAVIDGSTSAHHLLWDAAGRYHELTGADIVLGASGSDEGLRRLAAGEVDAAVVSRPVSQDERQLIDPLGTLVEIVIGKDSILLVGRVGPDPEGQSEALADLESFFATRAGPDGEHSRVLLPPVGSGTRARVEALVGRPLVGDDGSHDDYASLESVADRSFDYCVVGSGFCGTPDKDGVLPDLGSETQCELAEECEGCRRCVDLQVIDVLEVERILTLLTTREILDRNDALRGFRDFLARITGPDGYER